MSLEYSRSEGLYGQESTAPSLFKVQQMQRDIQELRTAVQQRDALIAELNARMQQDGQGDISHAGNVVVIVDWNSLQHCRRLIQSRYSHCKSDGWRRIQEQKASICHDDSDPLVLAGNLAERERALVAQTEQLQLVSQHQFEMQAQLAAVQKALQEQQASLLVGCGVYGVGCRRRIGAAAGGECSRVACAAWA
jgi:hypothetical protein